MRNYIIGLLIIMVIAQWAVPASMIIEQEALLANGKIYKFKTAPIDPTDPFRGSYLTLNFKAAEFTIDSSMTYKQNDKVFVNLTTDEAGFAGVKNISTTKPNTGEYIVAKTGYESYVWDDETHTKTNKKTVEIVFPFVRFYLEESKAKRVDDVYRSSNVDSTQISYAVVKVIDGQAAIEDVILNGKSVREIIKQANEKN